MAGIDPQKKDDIPPPGEQPGSSVTIPPKAKKDSPSSPKLEGSRRHREAIEKPWSSLVRGSLGINDSDDYALNLLRYSGLMSFVKDLHDGKKLASHETANGEYFAAVDVHDRFLPYGSITIGPALKQKEYGTDTAMPAKYATDLDLLSFTDRGTELRGLCERFARQHGGLCAGVGEGFEPEADTLFQGLKKLHQKIKDGQLQSIVMLVRLKPSDIERLFAIQDGYEHPYVFIEDDIREVRSWIKDGKFKQQTVDMFAEIYANYLQDNKGVVIDPALLVPTEDSIPVAISVECRHHSPAPLLHPVDSCFMTEDLGEFRRQVLLVQNPIQELVNKIGYFLSHEPNPDNAMDAAAMMDFRIQHRHVTRRMGDDFCKRVLPKLALLMLPALKKFHELDYNEDKLRERLQAVCDLQFNPASFTKRHFSSYRTFEANYGEVIDHVAELKEASLAFRRMVLPMINHITPEESTYLNECRQLALNGQDPAHLLPLAKQLSVALDADQINNLQLDKDHLVLMMDTGDDSYDPEVFASRLIDHIGNALKEAKREKERKTASLNPTG